MNPVRVGAVVLIAGIAEPYVAVTLALCPPVPPFTLNDTVYVFAVHFAYNVEFAATFAYKLPVVAPLAVTYCVPVPFVPV